MRGKAITSKVSSGITPRLSPSALLLCVFALSRPLSLLYRESGLGGLNLLELFAIGISYVMILVIIMNIRRFPFDPVSLVSILFCVFCVGTIAAGSVIQSVAKTVLPFIIFFAVRCAITTRKEIKGILIVLFVGYIYPIVGSLVLIAKGESVGRVMYESGIEKFQGMFFRIHSFAHAMTFFSYVTAAVLVMIKPKKKIVKALLLFLLAASVFCLFKSAVRTTLVGFLIFWTVYLAGTNRKYLVLLLCTVIAGTFIYSSQIKTLIWMTSSSPTALSEKTLDKASTGRFTIWTHNLSVFTDLPFERKFIGVGLGNENKRLSYEDEVAYSSHNDYITLLMTSGIIGLGLYLLILLFLLIDIIKSKIDKPVKYLFIAVLIAVAAMNGLSNSYINRFELGQLFWLFIGIFYVLNDISRQRELYEPVSTAKV